MAYTNTAQRDTAHRYRGLVVFLVLSFGVSWAGEVGVRFGVGWSLADPRAQVVFALVPALAAVVVRRWVTREGFGDAGLRVRLRGAWPYYLVAWLGPFVVAGVAVGLLAAVGLARNEVAGLGRVVPGLPWWGLLLVLAGVVVVLAPVYWGEEFGWTSYLRLRVCPGRPLAATLVTGLVWAVWHFPLAFLGYVDYSNVVAGLALWTLSFLCQETVLSWLRLRSGTIWTTSLAHAGNNMVLSLLVDLMLTGRGRREDLLVMAVTTVPLAVAAGWVLVSGRYTAAAPRQPGQDFLQQDCERISASA
jgi:membrane protease YdiL (CAAX protease family)